MLTPAAGGGGPPAVAVAAVSDIPAEALDAYLRGRHFWAQRTPDGFEKALRAYRACFAIEPDFASAHAGCADTLVIMALYGVANAGLARRFRRRPA